MSELTRIRFVNRDAAVCEIGFEIVGMLVVGDIIAWYSVYHDRDDYDVYINDRKQDLDIDGRIRGLQSQ